MSRRNGLYYWDCAVFLVEGALFKIPTRYLKEESELFRTMFSLPPGNSDEGCSDERPIILEGIAALDFESLLKVMYPRKPTAPIYASRKDWMAALRLSTMWEFEDIRKLAIRELTKTNGNNAVEKVLLGKEFRVPEWLMAGYNDLVDRPETISAEETTRLGLETTVRLLRLRDSQGRRQEYCSRCGWRDPRYSNPRSVDRDSAVLFEFAPELRAVGHPGPFELIRNEVAHPTSPMCLQIHPHGPDRVPI